VLADDMMPEMTGPEMVTLLVELRPDTRAANLSGYSAEPLRRAGILEANTTP
jgi:YesN/AraC family two-component response regulator